MCIDLSQNIQSVRIISARVFLWLVFNPLLIRIRYYIRLHLIGIGQTVGAVKHIHHGNQLCHSLIVESEPLHGGTVGVNSVSTVVGDRNRQGDDLFGQQIEFAGLHDGF
jgi:hypothetical protein